MKKVNCEIDGIIIYWALAQESRLETLRQTWPNLSPRTEESAAKIVLEETYRDCLVRRTKTGFCAVREAKDEDKNSYSCEHYVNLVGGRLEFSDSIPSESREDMRMEYARLKETVSGGTLNSALVTWIKCRYGIALREEGAVYWLPMRYAEKFCEVAENVESAAVRGANRIYRLECIRDAGALRAIEAAICQEVESEAKRLSERIADEKLGARALRTVEAEAKKARKKILEYEIILDRSLATLKEKCGAVEIAAVQASLLVAAGAGD